MSDADATRSSNSNSNSNSSVLRFKVVILGDTGVGKTSLAVRFVRNTFRKFETTTGGTFYTKKIEVENNPNPNRNPNHNHGGTRSVVQFNIWDTAGGERFRSVAPLYYRGAAAAIIVYDVTSSVSLVRAKAWIDELTDRETRDRDRDPSEALLMVLVGNKVDLEPSTTAVTVRAAEAYANDHGVWHLGTSAKTATNVTALFDKMAHELLPPPELELKLELNPLNPRFGFTDEAPEDREEDTDASGAGTARTPLVVAATPGTRKRWSVVQRLISFLVSLCCVKRKRRRTTATAATAATVTSANNDEEGA